jgi:hypothetical protein
MENVKTAVGEDHLPAGSLNFPDVFCDSVDGLDHLVGGADQSGPLGLHAPQDTNFIARLKRSYR